MGVFKNLDIVLKNEFPDEEDYDSLFYQFYEWLNDDEKNMIFIPARKDGYYYDLCNDETVTINTVCEYWCQHIKKGMHNGEGFVIKQ